MYVSALRYTTIIPQLFSLPSLCDDVGMLARLYCWISKKALGYTSGYDRLFAFDGRERFYFDGPDPTLSMRADEQEPCYLRFVERLYLFC